MFLLIASLGMALVVGLIANGKGLPSPGAWTLYALFLWPVALIHVLLTTPPKPEAPASELRKCPECAEMIRTEARKCRYCQSAVAPIEKQPLSRRAERLRDMGY